MLLRTPKIEVKPVSLGTLIQNMAQGQLRVPRFQRTYVWEKFRIQALLDSMYNEYPIGTIFLWNAPAKYNHMLRYVDYLHQPPINKNQSYTFILDGQQRLTSLFVTINGYEIEDDDFSKIVVDLDRVEPSKLFLYHEPDNQRYVSIKDLLSTNNYALYDGLTQERRPRFAQIRDNITNYPFSVVTVSEMELDDAIEIFERINQQSKKLTRYDLIAASVLTDTFDLRDRTQQDIIQPLKSSFGEVAETSIPQALALNIKKRTEHSTQMSLETDEVQRAWDSTVGCLKLAVDFVRSNLGVKAADYLPYDGMLPVLAHYFFEGHRTSIKSPSHRDQIEQWFWRVAFSERYSGASQTRMTEDAVLLRDLATNDKPIDWGRLSIAIDERVLMQASMSSSSSAIRNGFLCLLNLLRPIHWKNKTEINISGDHFSRFTRAERHHIFPQAFLAKQKVPDRAIHQLPNFCFIPNDLNIEINNSAPSKYFSQLRESHEESGDFEKIMRTHLIPIGPDSGIWNDDFPLFMRQRAQLILKEIRQRCGVQQRMSEEQRNPAIDTIEGALRDTIHETLSAEFGATYWKTLPPDVKDNVDRRVDTHVTNTPGTSKAQYKDPRSLLEFVDVSDYSKIILPNWTKFTRIFPNNKADCERMLKDFGTYRNAVKHNRPLDSLVELRGSAAMLWLGRSLKLDMSKYGLE